MGTNTRVDLLALEDFYGTLTARLAEADSLIAGIKARSQDDRLPLGTFDDARATAETFGARRAEYLDRVTRLRQAIEVTISATRNIIERYRTNEAGLTATASDIAGGLGGVTDRLVEEFRLQTARTAGQGQ